MNDKNEILYDKSILIVEDDKVSLNIIKTILEYNNFTNIFVASSAKEAIKIIEKESIYLVLMNYSMPNMNGIEACNYIKNNLNIPESSIIIITSKNNDYLTRSSFKAGAIDFITKPLNPLELVSRIENVLKYRLSLENSVKQNKKMESMNKNLKEVMFSNNNTVSSKK